VRRRVRAHAQEERPVRIGACSVTPPTGCSMPACNCSRPGRLAAKKSRWSAAAGGLSVHIAGDASPRGHLFEARANWAGSMNTAWRPTKSREIAQREVDYLLAVGNIRVETEKMLGGHIELAKNLRREYDAGFPRHGAGRR